MVLEEEPGSGITCFFRKYNNNVTISAASNIIMTIKIFFISGKNDLNELFSNELDSLLF